MPRTKKWLAALAAGGSTVGAAIALANAPTTTKVTNAAASTPTSQELSLSGSESADLAAAVARANQLQTMIADLQKRIVADEKALPAGARTVFAPEQNDSPLVEQAAQLQAGQAQLAQAEQEVASEKQQLATEQAQLVEEQNQLQSEAAQLETEQKQIASVPSATTTPHTNTTTGASGAGHDD